VRCYRIHVAIGAPCGTLYYVALQRIAGDQRTKDKRLTARPQLV